MKRLWPWSFLFLCITGAVSAAPAGHDWATNRFSFRLPHRAGYRIEKTEADRLANAGREEWLTAWPEDLSTNFVQFSSRIVLHLKSPTALGRLISGRSLSGTKKVTDNVFILQAPDALNAAREAHRLAALPEVEACYPIVRQSATAYSAYAAAPTDDAFALQWPLENRRSDGSSAGPDLNIRAAWPLSLGQGITVAVADTGVELNHPELTNAVAGAPHYNFVNQTTNAVPNARTAAAAHGTQVAGLIAAARNNYRMTGVAPSSKVASWVIFTTNSLIAADDQLMTMYQYQSNTVPVQNHSWGRTGSGQYDLTTLENIGISNAVTFGRSGRGTVMVRAGGNARTSGANTDDDMHSNDPRVTSVAAVRNDGRVTSYSTPGASLLLGAPSGEANSDGLFSTDLLGTDGVNAINFLPPNQDLNGYVFSSLGFNGTSASAPHISGLAALMLSANTNLSYRDVQQIMILASRHFDLLDPDLKKNGAGLLVSHNQGFGVPDAGVAVQMARNWSSRPAMTNITLTATNIGAIPDDGLRVLVGGPGVPSSLFSIHCLPSVGPHADDPTLQLPLAYIGYGTNVTGMNLTNKAALIQRGSNVTFASVISNAAVAGASFAIVYNYPANNNSNSAPGGDFLTPMGGTDFVPIPAVFIGNTDGEALRALFATNSSALAQIHLDSTNYTFNVTDTLLCEHIGARVLTDHPLRGDVRITLLSPAGTRSVLQRYNADVTAGPVDWTYYTTHHFFESSAGQWTVSVSDEGPDFSGSIHQISLLLQGVLIVDRDHDGLDDNWEMAHFNTLAYGPQDDPDHDGYSNMREQLMGTDPMVDEGREHLNFSLWNSSLGRLSWSGSTNYSYQIWGGTNVAAMTLLTNVPGHFPETEYFLPYSKNQFYQVRAFQP